MKRNKLVLVILYVTLMPILALFVFLFRDKDASTFVFNQSEVADSIYNDDNSLHDSLSGGVSTYNEHQQFQHNFILACQQKNYERVTSLISAHPDYNNETLYEDEVWTPLHYAVTSNDEVLLKLLLSKGADPSIISYTDHNGLELAIYGWSIGLFKIMIEDNPRLINYPGKYYLPLGQAIASNRIEFVEFMMDSGADLHLKGNNGLSPCQMARESENETAQLVLQYTN